MSDASANPPFPPPRHDRDYEDPHYHDEEPEIHADDREGPLKRRPSRKKPSRLPPQRRRYED